MGKVWIVESFDGETNCVIGVFGNKKAAGKYKIYNEILDDGGFDAFYVSEYEIEENFNEDLKNIDLSYTVDFYENESPIGKLYEEINYVEVYRTFADDKEYIEYNKMADDFYICVKVPYKENETDDEREEMAKEKGLKLLKEWSKNNA